jgi:hypothetical protein
VKALRPLLIASMFALATTASAQTTAPDWKFEFHGFVSASLCSQNQVFVNAQCQGLLVAAPTPANEMGGATITHSGNAFIGDIRQSRFAFAISGPKAFGGAQPRGYFEFDLFGMLPTSSYNWGQPIPRIRVAIAELNWGAGVLQFGQQNQLVVTQIPTSLSHIANPITYQAGTIGWRNPGVRGAYTFALDGLKLELAAEVVKNSWADAPGGTNLTYVTPAQMSLADGAPMIQARLKADGKMGDLAYTLYAVYVHHSIDLNGIADTQALPAAAAGKTSIAGNVFEAGGKVGYGAWGFISGNYYSGSATGNMLGSMVAFGDIADKGYWIHGNFNPIKELGLYLTYGANTPDKADMRLWGGNTVRLANTMYGGMLKYQDGGYALGVEYWTNQTRWADSATASMDTRAYQIIGTAAYFF